MSLEPLQLASATLPPGLRDIPVRTWVWIAAGVGGIILLVVIGRKVAKMNKLLLIGVVLFATSIVGFNWIYERTEPAWATPAVSWLAGFFPSKGPVRH